MHTIPPSQPLIADLPGGRDFHKPQSYISPALGEDVLTNLRAPPDPNELAAYREGFDDSASESEYNDPVGAFPGTSKDYPSTSYY